MDLKRKVAIVTGAASDIGYATKLMSNDGAFDASEFITGQTIQIDGGAGMHALTFADFSQMGQ